MMNKTPKHVNPRPGRPSVSYRFVCFSCRKCIHKWTHHHSMDTKCLCPECRVEMTSVGVHFRAPKRNDIKAWKLLKFQMEQCPIWFGTNGSGYVPQNKREVLQRKQYRESKWKSDFGGEYGKNGKRVSYNARPLYAPR